MTPEELYQFATARYRRTRWACQVLDEDEAVQAAVVYCWTNRGRLQPGRDPRGYYATMVRTAFARLWKSEKRHRAAISLHVEPGPDGSRRDSVLPVASCRRLAVLHGRVPKRSRPGRRIRDAEIRDLWSRGWTNAKIADRIGMTQGGVLRAVRRLGLRRNGIVPTANIALVRSLREKGHSLRETARLAGISHAHVRTLQRRWESEAS